MPTFPKALPLLLTLSVGSLCGCKTMQNMVPDFSELPRPPLPKFSSLKKITKIIPGLPGSDKAAADDPKMPFNARSTLGYGHTLRLEVYEGARSASRIYKGVVMVNEQGILDFGDTGRARVGGGTLPRAVEAIAAVFRVGRKATRPLTVHIVSVEDVPVVSITGDVINEEFIPAWDGMTIEQAVRVAGGRRLGSTTRGVYLIREGVKRYFRTIEAAAGEEPEPGDIIFLSPDL